MVENKNIDAMLNQVCPSCGSKSGDIIAYMPIIVNDSLEIEIECENCGAKGILRGYKVEAKYIGKGIQPAEVF